jgi:hypothetical protein
MFAALVYWLHHEEFLEWLCIGVDECLPRHSHTFLLNILIIFITKIISYLYQKRTFLEMMEALIEGIE